MWACAHESPVAARPGLSLTNVSWIAAMVGQYPEARHRREALVNWLLQHTSQPGDYEWNQYGAGALDAASAVLSGSPSQAGGCDIIPIDPGG